MGLSLSAVADEEWLRVIEWDGEEREVGPDEVREFLEEHAEFALEEFEDSIDAAHEAMDEFAELMEEYHLLEDEAPELAADLLKIKKQERELYAEVEQRLADGENADAVARELEAQWKSLAILRLRFERAHLLKVQQEIADELTELQQLIKYPERVVRAELEEIQEELEEEDGDELEE